MNCFSVFHGNSFFRNLSQNTWKYPFEDEEYKDDSTNKKFFRVCILKLYVFRKRILTYLTLPPPPLPGFLKNVCSKEKVNPWFFVTFNIIISHIFPENFIEIPLVAQKIWRFFPSILTIFIDFLDFLTNPCYKETKDDSI